jgi:DNA polymerase I-like protein with 3'-5' exonuclease and polymerase domains
MEADKLRKAVMGLYATFRDLDMKSSIVMVIHGAVYIEAPVNEAERARHGTTAFMEEDVERPIVPLEVETE